MKILNVLVYGISKNNERVHAFGCSSEKRKDIIDILRFMKSQNFFNDWDTITEVYNADTNELIKEF